MVSWVTSLSASWVRCSAAGFSLRWAGAHPSADSPVLYSWRSSGQWFSCSLCGCFVVRDAVLRLKLQFEPDVRPLVSRVPDQRHLDEAMFTVQAYGRLQDGVRDDDDAVGF